MIQYHNRIRQSSPENKHTTTYFDIKITADYCRIIMIQSQKFMLQMLSTFTKLYKFSCP